MNNGVYTLTEVINGIPYPAVIIDNTVTLIDEPLEASPPEPGFVITPEVLVEQMRRHQDEVILQQQYRDVVRELEAIKFGRAQEQIMLNNLLGEHKAAEEKRIVKFERAIWGVKLACKATLAWNVLAAGFIYLNIYP